MFVSLEEAERPELLRSVKRSISIEEIKFLRFNPTRTTGTNSVTVETKKTFKDQIVPTL